MRLVMILAGALVLTGCGNTLKSIGSFGRERVTFDGQSFRARLTSDKADPAAFTSTVSEVSKSLEGALEAGRYEGTKHCIAYFGSSRIDWTVGPDTPVDQLVVQDDTLTFVGRCKG